MASGFFCLILFGIGHIGTIVGRRWARLAYESESQSDDTNKQFLTLSRSSKEGFILFLRGFKDESRSIKRLQSIPQTTADVFKATRWIESTVSDEFYRGRGMRTFGIANPSDHLLPYGIYRIRVPEESWEIEVEELANEARIIVIYISSLSKGIRLELDLIKKNNLMEKSILVVSRHLAEFYSEGEFPRIISVPSTSIISSTFHVFIGRFRVRAFRRALKVAIDDRLGT